MENSSTILRDLPVQITSKRLLLRPIQPGDGPLLWDAVEESREQFTPWLPWVRRWQKPEQAEAWARRTAADWLLREDLAFGAWEQSSGQFLGVCGLHNPAWAMPCFHIGYWLRASAWGKGYASEASRSLCRVAFGTFAAVRVTIWCDARNTRSAAVARRLGFVQEALLRNYNRDEEWVVHDHLIFALTPGDYARVREDWDRVDLPPSVGA